MNMSDENEKIACEVCKKMVPKAAAVHAEGEEYVLHFCDTSCLAFWEKENKKEDNKED
jgi:hypothetical protein